MYLAIDIICTNADKNDKYHNNHQLSPDLLTDSVARVPCRDQQ